MTCSIPASTWSGQGGEQVDAERLRRAARGPRRSRRRARPGASSRRRACRCRRPRTRRRRGGGRTPRPSRRTSPDVRCSSEVGEPGAHRATARQYVRTTVAAVSGAAYASGPGQEAAVPAPSASRRSPAARPRTSSGRSCAGPTSRVGDDRQRPVGAPRWRRTRPSSTDMRWSATSSARTSPSVALGDGRRACRPVGDRLGGEAAGEQGLADAFAGHHVGRRGGIAGEQHRPVGEHGPIDRAPGSARRGGDPRASRWARARRRRAVGRAGRPTASLRRPCRVAAAVAQHAEADVGPAVGQRERPGVAGQAGRRRTRRSARRRRRR